MRAALDKPANSMYPPETVEAGLFALARCNGNYRLAAAMLWDEGWRHPRSKGKIPEETVRNWGRRSHSERYLQIREEELPRMWVEFGDKMKQRLKEGLDIGEEVNKQISEALKAKKIEPRDLSNLQRNNYVGVGILTEKARTVDELPNNYEPEFNLGDFVRALKAEGFSVPEAMEQAIDAEVIEPEQLNEGEANEG